jgi:hypothetical protein
MASSGQYVLPPELVLAAATAEAEIIKNIEHVQNNYLVHRQVNLLRFEDSEGTAQLTTSELAGFLSLLRPRTFDSALGTTKPSANVPLTSATARIILRFAARFFDEIRDQICKGKKRSLDATTNAVLVALAGWLANRVGMNPPLTTAFASGMLIAILTATKGAFCKMTEEEAKSMLAEAGKK